MSNPSAGSDQRDADAGPGIAGAVAPRLGGHLARSLLVLLAGIVAFFALLPVDLLLQEFLSVPRKIGGDLGLVLRTLQQYGQGTVLVVTSLVIWLLDEERRARIADYLLSCLCGFVVVNLIKMAVGRPRPHLGEPLGFVGALGTYTTRAGTELSPLFGTANHSPDLWSTPSSHTAFAFMMSVFLSQLYPPLRPLVWPLAVLVALCRVLFQAHYPSDVVLGAAIGVAIATFICRGYVGVRLVDALAPRFGRSAVPALPRVLQAQQRNA